MTPQPAGYIPDAADAAVWRTAKNGKKFQIDTETGELLKGNLGPSSKSFSDYRKEHNGDHYAAAREFYKKELMGKPVKAKMGELGEHEVHFTGAGLKKLQQNMKNEPTKALLVEQLPSIIGEGKYLGSTSPHKERTDFVSFHHFQKKVGVKGRQVNVIVDVGRKPNGKYEFSAYNLAHSDSPRFEPKKEGLRKAGLTVEDSKKGAASDKGELSQSLEANANFYESIIHKFFDNSNPHLSKVKPMNHSNSLTFDASPSVRRFDDNGYLHVGASHITKATVNPYYGREIPNFEEAGLEPDKIYYGLRAPEELKKSLPTWSGLPLHIEHHIDSAHDPQKLTRVGAVGTEIVWNAPYVDAPLVFWDSSAIGGIEDGSYRELSCAYRYEPDFTPGEYEGKPYDFVMRNIRGNHVALVEEGRAGPDVLVADANIKPITPTTKRGNFMGKLKNWFRGARDADPGIEQKEVDLAQAIIDLHRVDPVTGEVVDIIGDEDKAKEIRKLVEELSGKLEPEEIKKLTDALTDLAYSKATGDKEPAGGSTHGMDKDDDEQKSFAEGVKYGEELERNPEERRKLDREHESEGMKKAMDTCGVDSESPAETRAFAEGVKYGEEKVRGEDEDKSAAIKRILESVPGLSPEQHKKLLDSLTDLAYSKATGDKEPAGSSTPAQDRALRRYPVKSRGFGATEAAALRAAATADAVENIRAVTIAAQKVRPLIGEVNPLAFDSARELYGYTLKQMGRNPNKYAPGAWGAMIDVMVEERANMSFDMGNYRTAGDAGSLPDSGPFAALKNIILA